jgi:hypothetical protein
LSSRAEICVDIDSCIALAGSRIFDSVELACSLSGFRPPRPRSGRTPDTTVHDQSIPVGRRRGGASTGRRSPTIPGEPAARSRGSHATDDHFSLMRSDAR